MRKTWWVFSPLAVLFIALPLLLLVGNYSFHEKWLPASQVIGVVALVLTYFIVHYAGFLILFGRHGWLHRIVAFLLLGLVLLTLFRVTHWAIYDLYPSWGLLLFDPERLFVQGRFEARIMSVFMFVVLLSLAAALFILHQLRKVREQQLYEQLAHMKARFSSAHIYPHFVESMTATAIGRSLLRGSRKSRRSLEQLAGVMRYVLDVQTDPDQMVQLQQEWRKVKDLASVARWKYGPDRVVISREGTIPPDLMTVPMSLVLLMENSLKHGSPHFGNGIVIHLKVAENGYQFTCSNPIGVDQGGERRGFGLRDLQMRMERSELDIRLSIEKTADHYTAGVSQLDAGKKFYNDKDE